MKMEFMDFTAADTSVSFARRQQGEKTVETPPFTDVTDALMGTSDVLGGSNRQP